jgi:hypothetical protein
MMRHPGSRPFTTAHHQVEPDAERTPPVRRHARTPPAVPAATTPTTTATTKPRTVTTTRRSCRLPPLRGPRHVLSSMLARSQMRRVYRAGRANTTTPASGWSPRPCSRPSDRRSGAGSPDTVPAGRDRYALVYPPRPGVPVVTGQSGYASFIP